MTKEEFEQIQRINRERNIRPAPLIGSDYFGGRSFEPLDRQSLTDELYLNNTEDLSYSPPQSQGNNVPYAQIAKGIEKGANMAVGALDSYGRFRNNLISGGLSILSGLVPENARRRRQREDSAVVEDSYGRSQYNNMFEEGGVISRADNYLNNYEKYIKNNEHREFLQQLINLKNQSK